MSGIRIIKASANILVSDDELRDARLSIVSDKPNPSLPEKKDYLLGMPAFNTFPFKGNVPVIMPVGQRNLAGEVLKNTLIKKNMISRMKSEYRSIVKALIEMKIGFHILNLEKGDRAVKRWLSGKGCTGLQFDADHPDRWQIFPRDMFVYIEKADTLLVHAKLFKLRKARSGKCRIIHTQWAEGGQVLFNGNRMMVGRHPESIMQINKSKVFKRLTDKGIKVAALPQAIFARLTRKGRGRCISLYHDPHLDRSASLLIGKDKQYHLLLDPGYRTGPLTDPLPVERSIDLLKKECEKNNIQVHVPKSISVPYGTAAVQFDNGRVLATGGDDEICFEIANIVGEENLFTTNVPVSAYPVFACAGLHCMITENPRPLMSL